ncbi:MAG: nitronate monooxygenase [Chloroflexi bacterium]|nr:nitronate monooxygenase [Chloroflexota bacterium]
MKQTRISQLLGIKYPIIQSAMIYVTSPEMVAAVSNTGGLGTLGLDATHKGRIRDPYEGAEWTRQQLRRVKSLTDKPFAMNALRPAPWFSDKEITFSEQILKVILEEKPPVVVMESETPEGYVDKIKAAGIKLLHHTLPITVEAARRSEQLGADAIIAVGYEGGGMGKPDTPPTFVLVPEIVDAVKIPVIAGGGIMDGRGIAAALCLGAEGVYMGTRFMATQECGVHPDIKQAVMEPGVKTVVVGDLVTRRLFKNPVTDRLMQMQAEGSGTARERARILNHGLEFGLTGGDLENGCIACGAGVRAIKDIPSIAELMARLVRETDAATAGLQG